VLLAPFDVVLAHDTVLIPDLIVARRAAYWVVDPLESSLTAGELVEGRYVDQAHVVGAETVVLDRPFRVEITPAELRDPDSPAAY